MVVSRFDEASFDHAVERRLRIRFRRAILFGLVGLPLFALGAQLLDSRGSPDQREIHRAWDVIGGLAGGIGLCLVIAAGFMMWTSLRWRWSIRRSSWVPSRVAIVPTWLFAPDGRLLLVLPDFHPDFVYSVGMSTVFSTAWLAMSTDVLVAGRRGSVGVIAVGASALVTIRPPRTGWTRRRWLWRFAHPVEANLGPLRRLLGKLKRDSDPASRSYSG
jgi:hypothetical protein